MFEMMGNFFSQIGSTGRVYTEVDYYTYIKAVEYLICIGFFVVYNLFWKKFFKPDLWREQKGA